jgi:hypothetical protein
MAIRSRQKDEELRDVAVFVKASLMPFVEASDSDCKVKRRSKGAVREVPR